MVDCVCLVVEEFGEGGTSGKEVLMTLKNSLQKTLLNLFVRSKKMAACVGSLLVHWGRSIKFSNESCIAFITKLLPLGVPTAWLYGRRWDENLSRRVRAAWLARRHWIAVVGCRGG